MAREHSDSLRQRLRVLGEAVRTARTDRGLSQEALADRAGLHRTYIGQVERGERNLSLGNLYALADALDLRASELLSD